MIAVLLGWTKLPQWVLELIVIGAVVAGMWYWQHERYDAGITAQRTADSVSQLKLQKYTDHLTAMLQQKATEAELAYEKEHKASLDYQRDHLDYDPVRLCNATTASRGRVSPNGTTHPGNVGAGTAATNVPTVPPGNSGSGGGQAGTDIRPMLNLLAEVGDQTAAELREYQTRVGAVLR